MIRIQHIAINVDNPGEVGDYYKRLFGWRELNRRPEDTGTDGVWLTDGYIYFAILPASKAPTPLPGGTGIHHFGVTVDDIEKSASMIEEEGATKCPDSSSANRKYIGKDGVIIDLRAKERGFWDKRVGAGGTLYKLVPADTDTDTR